MRKNFRTYTLAVEFYKKCQNIKLDRHLKDQLNRASSSIVLNLAEGSARHTKGDQLKFYYIAFSSLREVQSILDISLENSSDIIKTADSLGAHLYKLVKASN